MRLKGIALCLLLVAGNSFAQPAERRISRTEYIEMWKDEAIKQMHMHGIPASITLAQGILESANGNSALAKYAHNHFGIKCHGWEGATFIQDDDRRNECFRKYEDANGSFRDHSLFLTSRGRYAFLFDLDRTDYRGWCHGLKTAGYATNPKYAYLLIDIIEYHNLDKYDTDSFVARVDKKVIPQNDEIEVTIGHSVEVQDNGVNYVIAGTGDTFYKIAKEFDLSLNQLYKYNDLGKKAVLHSGDIIYVQRKKGRAKQDTHTVRKGDTMWKIAQIYGIKLRKLYRKNNIEPGDEPAPGTVINLRKRKK